MAATTNKSHRFFDNTKDTLTFHDLLGTRIPGVRKVIKYGAQNQILKSRLWLVVCLIAMSIMSYHINYYMQLYNNQTIHIIRSYEYPTEVTYPEIIMCTPTSFSFSRLIRNKALLLTILGNLDTPSLYNYLLTNNVTNIKPDQLLDLLKLRINETIIECSFQGKPCNLTYMTIYRYAVHACFIVNAGQRFATTVMGRDGGLEMLLNMNAYDGIEERLGIAGGLQIYFLNSKYMEMPHSLDVVYSESGRLNAISLLSHKRISIMNCTSSKQLAGYLEANYEDTHRTQVRFYNKSHLLPCTMQNYYYTKTTAKLLGSVVYAKLTTSRKRLVRTNAARSNELKSIHVTTIRNKDSKIVRRLLWLTEKLIESSQNWKKPKCGQVRYKLNINVATAYIRGKAEAIETFAKGYLDQNRRTNQLYGSLYRMRVEQLVKSVGNKLVTMDVKRNSKVFQILKGAAIEWQSFVKVEVIERQQWMAIENILGNVNLLERSTFQMMRNEASRYYEAHIDLQHQIKLMTNCYIANQDLVYEDVPFIHSQKVDIMCFNSKNNSMDYGQCPDEIKCPNFDQSYAEKYSMPFAYMRDSVAAPLHDIHAAVYQFCAIAVVLKDKVRGLGLEMVDSHAPWFDLFSLNELAMTHVEDDKMFDRHDIECRTYQACFRIAHYVSAQRERVDGEHHQSFDLDVYTNSLLKEVGALGFKFMHDRSRLIDLTYPYLRRYVEAYKEVVVLPFEKFRAILMQFRSIVSMIHHYEPPQLLLEQGTNSLIEQLVGHLNNHIETGNMSLLAHFMNRRGKIMVGRMRIYAQEVHAFYTRSKEILQQIYHTSTRVNYLLKYELNNFTRLLRENVTTSILSRNLSYALHIIDHAQRCAASMLILSDTRGRDTLERFNDWLVNMPQIQSRAKQYEKDQTLDDDFVKNNFVHLEIYFEDLAVGVSEEQYPLTMSALISRFGAIGRFYMGLKIFNVAEFLGPILLFIIYRVYLMCIRYVY